jgi:sugar phosphate isomerase/epimerase
MKVGIGSYAYRWAIGWGHMDAFALLDSSARAGAAVVQICDNLPLAGWSDAELDELAGQAASLDLSLELGLKGSQPEHLRCHLALAQRLQARLLRVVLTVGDWEPSFDEFVTIFRSLVPDLESTGVTVAIENHFHLHPSELARLVWLIDSPLVGVCLDPLNSIIKLVSPSETVTTLAPLAVSVHAKDALITRHGAGFYIGGCRLGDGLVDIRGMLAEVKAAGRSPDVLLECWMDELEDRDKTLAQEDAWVREGVSHLKQIVREL